MYNQEPYPYYDYEQPDHLPYYYIIDANLSDS